MSRAAYRLERIRWLFRLRGNRCSICGGELSLRVTDHRAEDYITFDHIIPRSEGGSDKIDNVRLAHQRCNHLRGAKPAEPVPPPKSSRRYRRIFG